MIICQCNRLTDTQVHDAIEGAMAADFRSGGAAKDLSPDSVYATIGRQGQCCGCYPRVQAMIQTHQTPAFRLEIDAVSSQRLGA